MAAAFKSATVNASDVPATQTNFPVYVDLSRLGITTLAEAESVRVYADSAKTTEWAREIVSASEMHVKVPSLTSTTTIYVDYDGIRADYAVSATYGRNAVWSGYVIVSHYGSVDATGNHGTITNNGSISPGDVAGPFGLATTLNGSTQYFSVGSPTGFPTGNTAFTTQVWAYQDSGAGSAILFETGPNPRTTLRACNGIFWGGAGATGYIGYGNDYLTGNGVLSATTWTKLDITYNPNAITAYKDASSVLSNGSITSPAISQTRVALGANSEGGEKLDGRAREWRVTTATLSANWLTTEHHNQSDEAGFWGTWTTLSTSNSSFFFLM
jgi:hypothetical protein